MYIMGDQYTLKLLVDDSQVRALEQRLGKMMGLSGTTTGAGQGGGGGAGVGGMAKNIAKLGAIAVGVTGILAIAKKMQSLVIESSPILQAMFKLFNTSLLFIFRPIGDFIGFFLRPLTIFFMRNIAIPFYRIAAPIMRQWGSSIGNGLVAFLSDPFGALTEWFSGFDWKKALDIFAIVSPLGAILKAVGLFNVDLGNISAGISEKFTGAMDRIGTLLNGVFGNFFTSVRRSFAGMKNFFAGIWASITETFKPAWDALTSLWEAIADFFKPIFDAMQGIVSFFTGDRGEEGSHTSFNQTGAGDARSRSGDTTTINIIEPHISSEQELYDFEEKVLEVIERKGRGRFRT